jgi:hypothetical protein
MSRLQLLRISTVNLLVLVLVVLLLWARRPLVQLQQQLQVGMQLSQVAQHLGPPLPDEDYRLFFTLPVTVTSESKTTMRYVPFNYAMGGVHQGLSTREFVLPYRAWELIGNKPVIFRSWFDSSHGILVIANRDGIVEHIYVFPINTIPFQFLGIIRLHFAKACAALGIS